MKSLNVNKPINSVKSGLRDYGLLFVLSLALSLPSLVLFSTEALAVVANTKHNLGTYSPGTVKTSETTQICIFCHTPHSAAPSGPIWNRSSSGATYTVYGTSTTVTDLGQPTGSSKLCLSCHDGTIAIGSLLNLPGMDVAGSFTMSGVTGAGKMLTTSVSNLGTDLSDDHPISFDYNSSYPDNTEIIDINTVKGYTGNPLALDDSDNVQCTTCHDPHGTVYDKFLTVDVQAASICIKCHTKLYWSSTVAHNDSADASTWNGIDPNPWHLDLGSTGFTNDTLSDQACFSCHRSHGGAAGISLTKGDDGGAPATEFGEEWTCLNCHNGNMAAVNIEPYFDQTVKVSEHPVMLSSSGGAMYNLHKPNRALPGSAVTEAQTDLDNNNRHSECVDCHNPHGAEVGNHTVGGTFGYRVGANLLGGWGVKPSVDTWPSAGTSILQSGYDVVDITTLNTADLDNREGYMCMKCHSSYAYGTLIADRPEVPSGNANGNTAFQSELSADFNPNNYAYHPVFAIGKNQPAVTANTWWSGNGLTDTFRYTDFPGGTRSGFYLVESTSTINCSDCHGSDAASDLRGPHGSANKWILRSNETGSGTAGNFCFNCHRMLVYGDEDNLPSSANAKLSRVDHPVGLSTSSPFYQGTATSGGATGNSSNSFGNLCLTCHGGFWEWDAVSSTGQIKGVHGSNASAGSQSGSDALGYRLMNGACVESYKRPTSTQAGQIWFKTSTDDHCLKVFSTVTINYNTDTHHDCTDITDCNP